MSLLTLLLLSCKVLKHTCSAAVEERGELLAFCNKALYLKAVSVGTDLFFAPVCSVTMRKASIIVMTTHKKGS